MTEAHKRTDVLSTPSTLDVLREHFRGKNVTPQSIELVFQALVCAELVETTTGLQQTRSIGITEAGYKLADAMIDRPDILQDLLRLHDFSCGKMSNFKDHVDFRPQIGDPILHATGKLNLSREEIKRQFVASSTINSNPDQDQALYALAESVFDRMYALAESLN
jgi:hypothetical protein